MLNVGNNKSAFMQLTSDSHDPILFYISLNDQLAYFAEKGIHFKFDFFIGNFYLSEPKRMSCIFYIMFYANLPCGEEIRDTYLFNPSNEEDLNILKNIATSSDIRIFYLPLKEVDKISLLKDGEVTPDCLNRLDQYRLFKRPIEVDRNMMNLALKKEREQTKKEFENSFIFLKSTCEILGCNVEDFVFSMYRNQPFLFMFTGVKCGCGKCNSHDFDNILLKTLKQNNYCFEENL